MYSSKEQTRHEKLLKELAKQTLVLEELTRQPQSKKNDERKRTIHSKIKNLYKDEKLLLAELKRQVAIKERQVKAEAKVARAEQKAKQEEKEIIRRATRTIRALSTYNYFCKSHAGTGIRLPELAQKWRSLSSDEIDSFARKANEFNAKQKELWTEAPRHPGNAYSEFVRQNFPADSTITEAAQRLSVRWKELSQEEKDRFKPAAEKIEKYTQAYKNWVEQRVQRYIDNKNGRFSS